MAEKNTNSEKTLKNSLVYFSICISVIFIVLFLNRLDIFQSIELKSQDMRFRIRGIEPHSEDIVIVGIDPQTLDMLGIFGVPPREYHVKLIENLYRAGAKAVLFDILFLSYTGAGNDVNIGKFPSYEDSLLAQVLKKYPNTVIARKLKIEIRKSTRQTVGEATSPPELFQNPSQFAFVNMYQDNDMFIRRTQLIANDIDPALNWNYSYSLKAAMFARDADSAWIDTQKHIAYVSDRIIPLDEENFMTINFAMDEETYQKLDGYIPYEQVIDDSEWGIEILMKNNRFKDKVVMIGATWPESHDDFETPFYLGTSLFSKDEYPMYGVHVHKNISTTILQNRFIQPTKDWQYLFLVIIMAILATLINWRFRGILGALGSILLIIVYSGMALFLFLKFRRLVPVVAPAFATVIINYISVVTYNFLSERRQKAMIRGAFSQYVPPSVVGELLKSPDKLTLGGEERVMTVLFSDVEGFTTISENLTPTQLVELLNEYLTTMTDIILTYNGIIDKYEGDAIMAEFGAPLPDENHAVNACLTALDMQEALTNLREKLKKEGRAELRARVGINSGPMVIGNMGSMKILNGIRGERTIV